MRPTGCLTISTDRAGLMVLPLPAGAPPAFTRPLPAKALPYGPAPSRSHRPPVLSCPPARRACSNLTAYSTGNKKKLEEVVAILEAGSKLPFTVQPAAVDLPELQVGRAPMGCSWMTADRRVYGWVNWWVGGWRGGG